MSRERALLLDTHVWIWFVEGAADELSPACVREIEYARLGAGVRVSAISVREASYAAANGRLKLARPFATWMTAALEPLRLMPLSLDTASAMLSCSLPGILHRDPGDQMIIASAMVHGLTLVTRDRRILDHARAGHLHVMDASASRIRH